MRFSLSTPAGRWARAAGATALLLGAVAFLARPALPRAQVEPLAVNGGTPFGAYAAFSAFEGRDMAIQVNVPPGKILIVKHVSVEVSLPFGDVMAHVVGATDSASVRHILPLRDEGQFTGNRLLAGSEQMTFYTDHGVRFELSRTTINRATVSWGVSGLLVDK